MTNNGIINEETGCTGDGAGPKEPHTHLGEDNPESISELVQKSNDITMTPARATKDITAPKTEEREQSTAKKSRSARKKDLLSFFGEGAQMPPSSKEGTPVDAVKMQRTPGSGAISSKKKRDKTDGNDAIGQKKSKSDNEDSHKGLANLEQMDETPLKPKGSKPSSKKGKAKKGTEGQTPNSGKKKATFAEMVDKEVVEEKEIKYKTCVVGFAVRVERTKDIKGGFDKKLMEGLMFMQTYIDKNASFHPIKPSTTLKLIKEKGNFPKFQVTS
jgi:hypothetical protein